MTEDVKSPEANEEQLLYAKILEIGMYLGLAMLLVTFLLYILGIMAPAVPIDQLPNYWTVSVHDYVDAINHDFLHRDQGVTGWAWMTVLGKGDFVNFLGIAVLSGVTIICYIGIVPTLIRKKQTAYVIMAIAAILTRASIAGTDSSPAETMPFKRPKSLKNPRRITSATISNCRRTDCRMLCGIAETSSRTS